MLLVHRDNKVTEGAIGGDRGHLRMAVVPSSLQHVRTKLSNTHTSCSVKGVFMCACVRVCVSASVCACCICAFLCACARIAFLVGRNN